MHKHMVVSDADCEHTTWLELDDSVYSSFCSETYVDLHTSIPSHHESLLLSKHVITSHTRPRNRLCIQSIQSCWECGKAAAVEHA
jgi:hypothetical protein